MEQPDKTNSTPTKRTLTPTAEMTAVPLLQALLYRQRNELATERAAVKALQRARAAEIKAVREESVKCRNLLRDFKSRYGSYYTAPFACFLVYFSDAVSAVKVSVELKECFNFIGQTDRPCYLKWNDLYTNEKTLSQSGVRRDI
jgi:hypothetical protein